MRRAYQLPTYTLYFYDGQLGLLGLSKPTILEGFPFPFPISFVVVRFSHQSFSHLPLEPRKNYAKIQQVIFLFPGSVFSCVPQFFRRATWLQRAGADRGGGRGRGVSFMTTLLTFQNFKKFNNFYLILMLNIFAAFFWVMPRIRAKLKLKARPRTRTTTRNRIQIPTRHRTRSIRNSMHVPTNFYQNANSFKSLTNAFDVCFMS